MKLTHSLSLIAASAAIVAGSFAPAAFAQDKTRAEVKSETPPAAKTGAAIQEASPAPMARSSKPRAQVKQERDASAGQSKAERTTGDAGVAPLPRSTKTRVSVKAERDAAKPKTDAEADKAKVKEYVPTK